MRFPSSLEAVWPLDGPAGIPKVRNHAGFVSSYPVIMSRRSDGEVTCQVWGAVLSPVVATRRFYRMQSAHNCGRYAHVRAHKMSLAGYSPRQSLLSDSA